VNTSGLTRNTIIRLDVLCLKSFSVDVMRACICMIFKMYKRNLNYKKYFLKTIYKMSDTASLFLYLDQINSIDTLISSISTPNIVIVDSNEFDIDVITDTVNNIANLQHVGFLYEHSATTNGFPVYLTNILQEKIQIV
jgi:hypothetical protein